MVRFQVDPLVQGQRIQCGAGVVGEIAVEHLAEHRVVAVFAGGAGSLVVAEDGVASCGEVCAQLGEDGELLGVRQRIANGQDLVPTMRSAAVDQHDPRNPSPLAALGQAERTLQGEAIGLKVHAPLFGGDCGLV